EFIANPLPNLTVLQSASRVVTAGSRRRPARPALCPAAILGEGEPPLEFARPPGEHILEPAEGAPALDGDLKAVRPVRVADGPDEHLHVPVAVVRPLALH